MTEDKPPLRPKVATSQRSVTLKWAFIGVQGLRTGWKALLFVSIVIALFFATQPPLNFVAPRPHPGSFSLRTDLIREFWFALIVLAATWVMAKLERRPVGSYGYADAAGPRRLLVGACWDS